MSLIAVRIFLNARSRPSPALHGKLAPMHADSTEEDDVACYRHPKQLTALRCVRCDRPICVDCAITAPVGMKCPECGRQSRSALARVPQSKLALGIVAAGTSGAASGFLFDRLPTGLFFSLVIAWLLGNVIGEATRRASGGFRDIAITRVAATAAFFGILWPLLERVLNSGLHVVQGSGEVSTMLGAGIAAYAAAQRINS